jgi:plastocyanin
MRVVLAPALSALVLSSGAPALAATAPVTVGDDFFAPTAASIAPGDAVLWSWNGSHDHTVRAYPRQTESFRSPLQSGTGMTFQRAFARPGRFAYFCEVHPFTMRASVQVGTPETTRPRIRRLRARPRRGAVTLSFRLSERSVVTARLRGARRKTVRRVLGAGRRSLRIRRLRRGRYRTTLTARDGWGNRSGAVVKHFRIG